MFNFVPFASRLSLTRQILGDLHFWAISLVGRFGRSSKPASHAMPSQQRDMLSHRKELNDNETIKIRDK